MLLALGLTSCNQDAPEDAKLFTGKYIGNATYLKTGEDSKLIRAEDVTITVFKIGDTYTFRFSDKNIPTIKDVKMKAGDNTLVTIGTEATGVITITADDLTILGYTTKEGTWNVPLAKRK